ncbi:hypothetical protein BDW74DRAFT_40124 [Aspergillus multicolor]|uniref:uncharacterized protein n=1 Tax=Aspergillus multicolor TaxID=41759 RepID=UPI003CCDB1C6
MPSVESAYNGLGGVSKLPVELRYMIYNHLREPQVIPENKTPSESADPVGTPDSLLMRYIEKERRVISDNPKGDSPHGAATNAALEAAFNKSNPGPLAILRTSKTLYHEVSYELYKKLNNEFFIRPVIDTGLQTAPMSASVSSTSRRLCSNAATVQLGPAYMNESATFPTRTHPASPSMSTHPSLRAWGIKANLRVLD